MAQTTAEEKKALRRAMRSRRQALDQNAVRQMSALAQQRILVLPAWQKATTVLAYAAVKGELQVDQLIEDAWSRGVRVLLPRCRPQEPGAMDVACVQCTDDVSAGAFSIPEPDPATCPAERLDEQDAGPDLVLVPGLAFDRKGRRLGQGGGYYDRLLAKPAFQASLWVGVCYGFQLIEHVPAEPWDTCMHYVCTDEESVCP